MINHYLAARRELEAPGSFFAVSNIDVRGVTVKTFTAAPPTMRAIWEMTAGHGAKTYLVYEDERYTIQVKSVERSLVQAVELGGKKTLDPYQIPGGALIAGITDPEGNPLMLVQQ